MKIFDLPTFVRVQKQIYAWLQKVKRFNKRHKHKKQLSKL